MPLPVEYPQQVRGSQVIGDISYRSQAGGILDSFLREQRPRIGYRPPQVAFYSGERLITTSHHVPPADPADSCASCFQYGSYPGSPGIRLP
jgi:hypothetical protein